MPALRSKQKLRGRSGDAERVLPQRTPLSDGSADPGEVSQESTLFAGKAKTRSQLEATLPPERGSESPVLGLQKKFERDAKPTLSQTWTADKPASAICVQSVDAHMSCSSHSDAQLAAFFIDPRAK